MCAWHCSNLPCRQSNKEFICGVARCASCEMGRACEDRELTDLDTSQLDEGVPTRCEAEMALVGRHKPFISHLPCDARVVHHVQIVLEERLVVHPGLHIDLPPKQANLFNSYYCFERRPPCPFKRRRGGGKSNRETGDSHHKHSRPSIPKLPHRKSPWPPFQFGRKHVQAIFSFARPEQAQNSCQDK